jgi:N-acetylmuramoyl-L-alanine amidase
MHVRGRLEILLIPVVLAIAGCQPGERTSPEGGVVEGPSGMISVQTLAGRLGMQVTGVATTHVTLKNSTNTVLIFTSTGGRVYINAKPIGEVGEMAMMGGAVYVGESLLERIRAAMRGQQAWKPSEPRKVTGCIVVDAGHGGRDPGAVSRTNSYEKTVNLSVARKLALLLRRRGLQVVMTRDSDRFVELEDRAAIANRYNARLFVSIHADSFPQSSRRGYTVYVSRSASLASRRAASAISKAMGRTGLSSQGIQRADYRVLVQTRCPAVLVELGYLSNYREAKLLSSGSFQSQLAAALANGISYYLSGSLP